MTAILRPKQFTWIDRIKQKYAEGYIAPAGQAPTAFGKTRCFAHMAHSAERRGRHVYILCHRDELVDQIVTALNDCGVKPAIVAAGYCNARSAGGRNRDNHASVTVASIHTLVRRLDNYTPPTLIIIDECHHVVTGGTYHKIISHFPNAKRLGVTATPIRLDGHGLAAHFDTLVVGPSVRELIADGHLAHPRVFAPPTVDTSGLHIRAGDYMHEEAEELMDTPTITGDALFHYRKHAEGLPALVFCTSVAHAHHVADRFRAGNISALALDGGTHKDIRRQAVKDFREGKIKVITSVDIFSEGVDLPGCHVGIFLRPTASLGLYLQQCGRILRPAEGKTHAIILDHVNNCRTFGLPDEDREWTLTTDIIRKKRETAPSIRICPKCWAASAGRALSCRECGHVFEIKPRQEVEEREGELVELTAEQIARKRERSLQGRSRTLAELEAFAHRKGYAPGWAKHVWDGRQRKESA
jgi:DNA repair protein RadD